MGRILIVEDERNMRRILLSNLRQDGHVAVESGGLTEARAALAGGEFDAVITDQKMPDGSGLEVLSAALESDPAIAVVFLTAVATIELAVDSMRHGAFDFIPKPFVPEVLRATVLRACERTRLVRENALLKSTVVRLEGSAEIVGSSAAIAEVRQWIGRVAPTGATVLITGETGTGKELVARAIHRGSPRASKPFVAVNCAAFTETLLESELFGHEKGAFTGADRSRPGLFEAAHEGTLFLDEAGEMSLAAQAKLLRVLTDGQVMRVGSTKPRTADVRVLVATHRDLEQRVRDGLFREDLYYRLAVVPIAIPPLRARREDIAPLCRLLVNRVAQELKVPLRPLSEEAQKALLAYSFPGNVRELRNLIERAYILSVGPELPAGSFPFGPPGPKHDPPGAQGWTEALPEVSDLRGFVTEIEKALIRRALRDAGGTQAQAARRLGLSRSDLGYKLTKYALSAPADSGETPG
jgi:two-component system response regulator HydG